MAGEANPQPTVLVKCTGRVNHSLDYRRQRRAHLPGRHALWQLPPQGRLGEDLEDAKSVGQTAAGWWKCPLGADETLLDGAYRFARARMPAGRASHRLSFFRTVSSTSSSIGWMTKLL